MQARLTSAHKPLLSEDFSRYFAAGEAVFLLALAWGVYHLRLNAWRAGFVLLAAGYLYPTFGTLVMHHAGLPAYFWIASLAVTATWMRWWYAQRRYF